MDVAVIETDFNTVYNGDSFITLGMDLDKNISDFLIMEDVLIIGYPPIPRAFGPQPIAARAEVNAIYRNYHGPHPFFILSSMAVPPH